MTFKRKVAYHEAGHAVAAWALGFRVGSLAIDERNTGRAGVDDREGSWFERCVVAMAGGPGGDRSGVDEEGKYETACDRKKATDYIHDAHRPRWDNLNDDVKFALIAGALRGAEAAAAGVFDLFPHKLEALADALFAADPPILSAEEVNAILGPSPREL